MDVGSGVWAAGAPRAAALEERGWAKFADFQPFCCSESGPRCSSPVDTGRGDAQGGMSQGPERTPGPAPACAWNVCVPRDAPLVASNSNEDEQEAAVASQAVSVGPGWEAPPPPAWAPRATGMLPGPASPAPAEATSTLAGAVPPETATAPGPVGAVTSAATGSPAVSTAAVVGPVTKDRKADAAPPAGAASNGPA